MKKKQQEIANEAENDRIITISKLRLIAANPTKTEQHIQTIIDIITSHDFLNFIEFFQIICKCLRPLLITWVQPAVSKDNPVNQKVRKLLKEMNHQVFRFKDYLHIILPEFKIFCDFAEAKIGGRISNDSVKTEGKTFKGNQYLKNFINYCEHKISENQFRNVDDKTEDYKFKKENNIVKSPILNSLQIKIRQYFLRQQKDSQNSQNQDSNFLLSDDEINDYMANLSTSEKYLQIDRQCLNCVSFFYSKNQFSYDCQSSLFPVDIISLDDQSKLGERDSQIKSLITSFLNTEKGGLILIGCNRIGTTLIETVGIRLTEKHKESVQQKIEEYIKAIKPGVRRNREIFIDFVPIYAHPGQPFIQDHIQGMYVVRIRAISKKLSNLYYIEVTGETCANIRMRKNGIDYELHAQSYYDAILDKFKRYSIQQETSEKNEMNKKKWRYAQLENHPHYGIGCEHPERGKELTDTTMKEIKQQLSKNQSQPQSSNKDPITVKQEKKQPHLLENESKYASLLVANSDAKDQFELACLNDESVQNILINKLKYNKNYPKMKKTWAVYHDAKFEKLKKVIEKKQIKNKDKSVHLIQVLLYLKVDVKPKAWEGYRDISINHLKRHLLENVEGSIANRAYFIDEAPKTNKVKHNYDNVSEVIEFPNFRSAIFAYFYLPNDEFVKDVKFLRGKNQMNNQYPEGLNYKNQNSSEISTFDGNYNYYSGVYNGGNNGGYIYAQTGYQYAQQYDQNYQQQQGYQPQGYQPYPQYYYPPYGQPTQYNCDQYSQFDYYSSNPQQYTYQQGGEGGEANQEKIQKQEYQH